MGKLIVPNAARCARWKEEAAGPSAIEAARSLVERAVRILEQEGGEAASIAWLLEDSLELLERPKLDSVSPLTGTALDWNYR